MLNTPPHPEGAYSNANKSGAFRLLVVVFLCCVGFWIYYPALSLPPSLIDDVSNLNSLDRWISDLSRGGIVEALKNTTGMQQRVYNVGFWTLTNLEYRLSGGRPFHWWRLIQLVAVCIVLLRLIERYSVNSWRSYIAAGVGVYLFLSSEVPGAVDLQSLRVNWFRLFATDAYGLFWLALETICLFAFSECPQVAKRWLYGCLAVIFGSLAFSIKLPFLTLAVAPLYMAAAAWLASGNRLLALRFASIASLIAGSFLAYFIVARSAAPPAQNAEYGSNFSLKAAHLADGLKYYVTAFNNMWGWMFLAVIVGTIISIGTHWKKRREMPRQFVLLVYATVFTICALGIYLPWNFRLPRYMLPAHFGLCLLTGLLLDQLLDTARLPKVSISAIILSVAVVTLALLLPWALFFMLAITPVLARVFKKPFAQTIILTAFAVGLAFQVACLPVSRSATNNYYVGREFANWDLTKQVLKFAAGGNQLCFAGDPADEHIGSMIGHVMRLGVEPHVVSTTSDECTSDSIVLVSKVLSPPSEQERFSKSTPIISLNQDNPAIKVPVNFWEFRRRMLNQGINAKPYDIWNIDYVWRFYPNT